MLFLTSLLLACTPDNEIQRRSHTDVFAQEPLSEVDILWVIDDSNSMAEEQLRVADGFEAFIQNLAETNIDFHVGVISTDMDIDNPNRGVLLGDPHYLTIDTPNYVNKFANRVQVGTEGSDKEKGISASVAALSEPLVSGVNEGFLREDAHLSIIYVSDEDDCSDNDALAGESAEACYSQEGKLVAVKDLIYELKGTKDPDRRVLASAIVGPEAGQGCADSWPGHRYQGVSEQLGGQVHNICEGDFSAIMEELGLAVSELNRSFQLSYTPVLETMEVVVENELIDQDDVDGWSYDDQASLLVFAGDYVPPRGAQIQVTYEVAGAAADPEDE
ncbi:MAG: hypothetical protein VX899_26100 [Myxococcota bacterium]|nr:hypothetical protein [Myxococcota bacterium]